jgi:hypothetical protein
MATSITRITNTYTPMTRRALTADDEITSYDVEAIVDGRRVERHLGERAGKLIHGALIGKGSREDLAAVGDAFDRLLEEYAEACARLPEGSRVPDLEEYHTTADSGTLTNYRTGESIRPATEQERTDSREAAKTDGGAGVIEIDGVRCYVED